MGLLHYFSQDGKIGYKNYHEEIIIQPQYDDGPSSFGRYDALGEYNEYCYVVQNDKYGILHQSGELTIPCIYRDAHPLFDDLFAVKKRTEHNKSAYGVINSKSEIIIPFEYIKICSSGKYIQCYKEQSSDVDAYHREPIGDQFWFNSLGTLVHIGKAYRALGDNLITMDKVHNSPNKQQLGLIDSSGNVILSNEYDQIDSANNGCYIVRVNDGEDWRVGVVQHDGNLLIPLDYKSIKHHDTNFFECFLDCDSDYQYDNGLVKRYSYSGERHPHWYNYDGKLIHDDEGRTLNEQLLAIKKNGKWGVCSVDAVRIVNSSYDDIRFMGGKILIRKDDCIGFINPDGTAVIPTIYNSIESARCSDELYTDRYERKTYGKYFISNPFSTVDTGQNIIRSEVHSCKGEKFSTSRYNTSYYHPNHKEIDFTKVMILRTDSYAELFLVNEGILPNSKFEQIFHFSEKHFAVEQNGSWGVYSSDKKELIIPCEYQQITFDGGDAVLLQKDNLWGALTLNPPVLPWDVEINTIFADIKTLRHQEGALFGVKIIEVNYNNEEHERYSIVDIKGEEVLNKHGYNSDNITSQFTYYNRDNILCAIGNKYGFISLDGYHRIPFKYDEVIELSEDLFNVRINKSWGVLSLEKGEIVPVKYKDPLPINLANCIVVDSASLKKGMLSESGSEKIPAIYDQLIHGFDDYRLTHYDKYILVGYGGDSESGSNCMFSGVDDALWGCLDNNGKTIVPIKYDCIKIVGEYILAGRDAELFTENLRHHSEYTGVYDLYNKTGELIIGGFREFEYVEAQGIFKFLFGGKWAHERDLVDEWNYIYNEYNAFNNKNSRWLVTDKNLRSIKLTNENTQYCINKGFKLTIRTVKGNDRIVNYWNCSLDIFFKTAPKIVGEYLIAENEDQYYIIRLSDGKETVCYDDIEYITDNLFFVRNGDYVGIVNFDGNIILPINYVALTYPVNSFIFGVTEEDDGICDVDLIDISSQVPKEYCAVSHAKLSDVLSRIKHGMFGIYINDDSKGLKSISVYRKHIFDQDFQNLIASYEEEKIHKKFSQRYWFSDHSDLREKQSYKDDCDDNYDDYMRDSWDAMTDGMYGDMPDGFDGDYSFLGYD